ncbi:MAG: threonine synthase [Verrucomicrobiae bacterium]|nr:threonine synthase [Verrucomicrobiae bacterium]
MSWRGILEAYRSFLPVGEKTPVVTLLEGNTPLVFAPRLSRRIAPDAKVYLKCEGLNPTGSFKDRGMTIAISKALERGAKAVICASTGNTSASAAAYAARAGLACFVLLPKGKIARGKLAQALMSGAQVIAVKGNFDAALDLVRGVAEEHPVAVVNSVNPDRIEGQKTAAFEIVDALGEAPHYHFIPVGNAGNITAYWKGYREYKQAGKARRLPRMMGFQAAGAAPVFYDAPVKKPETVATAIRIGNPASWQAAKVALAQSNGLIDIVTDEEILETQLWLAVNEGVFVEPASAASVAGLLKSASRHHHPDCPLAAEVRASLIPASPIIVCTVTGHGLKDPDIVAHHKMKAVTVRATKGAVLEAMGLA